MVRRTGSTLGLGREGCFFLFVGILFIICLMRGPGPWAKPVQTDSISHGFAFGQPKSMGKLTPILMLCPLAFSTAMQENAMRSVCSAQNALISGFPGAESISIPEIELVTFRVLLAQALHEQKNE